MLRFFAVALALSVAVASTSSDKDAAKAAKKAAKAAAKLTTTTSAPVESIAAQFGTAKARMAAAAAISGRDLDASTLLNLYSCFKQATVGDAPYVNMNVPFTEAYYKQAAWAERRGKSAEDSLAEYLRIADSICLPVETLMAERSQATAAMLKLQKKIAKKDAERPLTEEEKHSLYGLFQQASEGDASAPPATVSFNTMYKSGEPETESSKLKKTLYKAHESRKGLSPADCLKEYRRILTRIYGSLQSTDIRVSISKVCLEIVTK